MSDLFNYDANILSDNEWDDLKNAFEIRDRISHPKTIESITITEYKQVTVILWYNSAWKSAQQPLKPCSYD